MAERLPDEPMTRNAGWVMDLELWQDTKRTVPFALTGYAALCQFRAAENNQESTLLAEAAIEVGSYGADEIFAADPAGNVLRMSLPRAETAAISQPIMYADVLVGPIGSSDPVRVATFRALLGDGESIWPT